MLSYFEEFSFESIFAQYNHGNWQYFRNLKQVDQLGAMRKKKYHKGTSIRLRIFATEYPKTLVKATSGNCTPIQ